ncbi:MAG: hypothetical protein LBE82_12245 [Chitinophagaceae bacterium]|jgi:predicted RNase H-like HicB family nuclease|nr:hypothetical protein [Chitinophagaceae bacterium]
METLKIIIGASKDHFGAYAENCEGVYGAGDTPALAIKNVLKAIELIKKNNPPKTLKSNYKIVYKYDAQSFLNYYKPLFSVPGLEKLTGINQKQLHHYASGLRKPRPEQRKKLQTAFHNLGKELLSVEF